MWVKWINAFFESSRASSAVIKSMPGAFLSGKDFIKCWISPGEKGFGVRYNHGKGKINEFSIFCVSKSGALPAGSSTAFERYELKDVSGY